MIAKVVGRVQRRRSANELRRAQDQLFGVLNSHSSVGSDLRVIFDRRLG